MSFESYNIITNIKDVLWYIENEDYIESYQQIKDMSRILNNNLHLIKNKKYYIEKFDTIKYKWYNKQ
jgi:hypothetical protein